jgi:hypothetical protein
MDETDAQIAGIVALLRDRSVPKEERWILKQRLHAIMYGTGTAALRRIILRGRDND